MFWLIEHAEILKRLINDDSKQLAKGQNNSRVKFTKWFGKDDWEIEKMFFSNVNDLLKAEED